MSFQVTVDDGRLRAGHRGHEEATDEVEEVLRVGHHVAVEVGTGAEEVRGERSKCQFVHVESSEMEVKLGRAPVSDSDHVAAKRGVPALGVLKSDPSATRKQ